MIISEQIIVYPATKIPFSFESQKPCFFSIDSVEGIRPTSAPTEIKMNGQLLAIITADAQSLEYKIPSTIKLGEFNQIEIEVGYHPVIEDQIDYDKVTFKGISINE